MTLKHKLFTHTDLDGVSCYVVAHQLIKNGVDPDFCDYDNIDEKVKSFIRDEEYRNYDRIWITDIGVKEDTAEMLNELYKDGVEVVLLDHHTNEHLEKYPWATIQMNHSDGRLTSGTSLLADYLQNEEEDKFYFINAGLAEYIENVRQYDSWDWTREPYKLENQDVPYHMHLLLNIIGLGDFLNSVEDAFATNTFFYFGDSEYNQIHSHLDRIEQYVEHKLTKVRKLPFLFRGRKLTAAHVFAEDHLNDVASAIYEGDEEVDVVVMYNMSTETISLRTNKDDVHVDEIAKILGGGGRDKTAGAPIEPAKIDHMIGLLF